MNKNALIDNYLECIEKFNLTTFEAYRSSCTIAAMLMSDSVQENDFKKARCYSDDFIEFKSFYSLLVKECSNE